MARNRLDEYLANLIFGNSQLRSNTKSWCNHACRICVFTLKSSRCQIAEDGDEVDSCVRGCHVFKVFGTPRGVNLALSPSPWQRIRLTRSLVSSNSFREREESSHTDRAGTTGCSFLWKHLYNAIYDLRLTELAVALSSYTCALIRARVRRCACIWPALVSNYWQPFNLAIDFQIAKLPNLNGRQNSWYTVD